MGFQEAARTVLEAIHRDVTYTAPVWQPPAGHEELHPLPRAKTNLDAYNYLVRDRGLDEELVDELMRQGRIYQSDKYKNVVFVGTDFDGVVASNFARSCDPRSRCSASTSEAPRRSTASAWRTQTAPLQCL